jgi:uncharacterized protein (TIGR02646 family)
MKTICKQMPPARFTQYAQSAGATYGGLPSAAKDALRTSLVNEQGGICAFCMQRIKDNHHSVRIAHCQSQSRSLNRALDYTNMVASCTGGEGTKDEHCDVSQKSRNLSLNPADASYDWDKIFRYTQQGVIDCDNPQWQQEVDDILRLNCDTLKGWRKSAWNEIVKQMSRRHSKTWPATFINAQIQYHLTRQGGKFQPFCMIIVYLLRKRLAHL